ncbi:type II toxin-antitoxin system YhaV family toxin [Marinobacterium mangrovicola]|uniref:Toxin YhaV n=1 Tax=Marinobacterium mangrovicola TaxID=1476959 RepID=A0A4R1GLZ7_9GAMM|nr:type II toxin-antitoxin system YhaV family toxin [Marinobacterium mangrovicola]TCK07189.1 toxin YhaV [Marinobacterium mangrovicola]
MPNQSSLVINGWTLFCHPLFLDEVDSLLTQVEALKAKDPENFARKNATKRLAAIAKLAFEVIPQNPALPEYRQGETLGNEHKHWFRAKFFQQYRLFFRFDSASKIIVFAWVNDEKNKRAYGSKTDAYRVFEKMFDTGHPPDDWASLLAEAKGALDRLDEVANKLIS